MHARTGSQDGTVHVWSGETGQKVTVLDGGHPGPTYNLQFNPKLMMAASACNSVVSRICCGRELPSKWKESSLISRLHPQMREKWGSIFCLGERKSMFSFMIIIMRFEILWFVCSGIHGFILSFPPLLHIFHQAFWLPSVDDWQLLPSNSDS